MMEVEYPLRFQGCSAWTIWKSNTRNSYKSVIFLVSTIANISKSQPRGGNGGDGGEGGRENIAYLNEDLVQLNYSKGLAQT